MAQAAEQEGIEPREVSFAGADADGERVRPGDGTGGQLDRPALLKRFCEPSPDTAWVTAQCVTSLRPSSGMKYRGTYCSPQKARRRLLQSLEEPSVNGSGSAIRGWRFLHPPSGKNGGGPFRHLQNGSGHAVWLDG
jgi:hypothetical protein